MQNEQDWLKGRAAEMIDSTPISAGKPFLKLSFSFLDLFLFYMYKCYVYMCVYTW